jgi:hypothetical protein
MTGKKRRASAQAASGIVESSGGTVVSFMLDEAPNPL